MHPQLGSPEPPSALTLDGEGFPHGEQLAVCVNGYLVIQERLVHDEGVELGRVTPAGQDAVRSAGPERQADPPTPHSAPQTHVSMATPCGVVGALWRRMCACISGKLALM